ncbi:MAG: glycosyltransferase family 39 protein [Candidatus Margulisiibacteriota bacterium]
MLKKVLLTLAAFGVVRLALSLLFPMTADESYYWLWSKHLALSYVDHPPMVALINYLMTGGRESLLLLRLGPAIITFLVSVLIYFLTREIWSEEIAFWSAVLFQIVPHFFVIWLTMFVELPLALFWTASVLLLVLIIKYQKNYLWYLLAAAIGLGTLSKYTMFLFWPSLVLFFILVPQARFWLKRKEPYLCFLLACLFFLPVFYWNAQNNFISFTFHAAKTASDPLGENFLAFIADQLVHYALILFILFGAYRYALKRDNLSKLLFCFSALPLAIFFIAAIKVKVWAHWPAIGYLTALPLILANIMEQGKSIKPFFRNITLFLLLILIILFWASPSILLHQGDYARNYQLANTIPKDIKIFARTNVSASLLEFYLKRPTYLATGSMKPWALWGEKQYEMWGIPDLKKGESVLYYGEDNPDIRQQALKYFDKVSETNYRLYLIEDYINNYKMLKLEGFKGTSGHP